MIKIFLVFTGLWGLSVFCLVNQWNSVSMKLCVWPTHIGPNKILIIKTQKNWLKWVCLVLLEYNKTHLPGSLKLTNPLVTFRFYTQSKISAFQLVTHNCYCNTRFINFKKAIFVASNSHLSLLFFLLLLLFWGVFFNLRSSFQENPTDVTFIPLYYSPVAQTVSSTVKGLSNVSLQIESTNH